MYRRIHPPFPTQKTIDKTIRIVGVAAGAFIIRRGGIVREYSIRGGNIREFVSIFNAPGGLEGGVVFIGVVDALDGVLLDGDHGAGGAGFQILADVRVAEDVDGAVGLVDELFHRWWISHRSADGPRNNIH